VRVCAVCVRGVCASVESKGNKTSACVATYTFPRSFDARPCIASAAWRRDVTPSRARTPVVVVV
jgi:uncharacterized protein (DUF2237 family)